MNPASMSLGLDKNESHILVADALGIAKCSKGLTSHRLLLPFFRRQTASAATTTKVAHFLYMPRYRFAIPVPIVYFGSTILPKRALPAIVRSM